LVRKTKKGPGQAGARLARPPPIPIDQGAAELLKGVSVPRPTGNPGGLQNLQFPDTKPRLSGVTQTWRGKAEGITGPRLSKK